MFTRALHWSLSWARSIQPIPKHPKCLLSVSKLFTHLSLGLAVSFLLTFAPKSYMHSSLQYMWCIPCPSYLYWPDHSIYTCQNYKLWSSPLCSFLQPPVTSSLFCPNILLSILFSNTFSKCSCLNIRDQVSHPYKTADFMYSILCFQTANEKTKGPGLHCSKHYLNSINS
jgi:hypothetical protein